jgi:hypothetical protein
LQTVPKRNTSLGANQRDSHCSPPPSNRGGLLVCGVGIQVVAPAERLLQMPCFSIGIDGLGAIGACIQHLLSRDSYRVIPGRERSGRVIMKAELEQAIVTLDDVGGTRRRDSR